jgi:hypothetical protein
MLIYFPNIESLPPKLATQSMLPLHRFETQNIKNNNNRGGKNPWF